MQRKVDAGGSDAAGCCCMLVLPAGSGISAVVRAGRRFVRVTAAGEDARRHSLVEIASPEKTIELKRGRAKRVIVKFCERT